MDDFKIEYPFSKNFFQIKNDIKMHFVDQGEGSVILMLHGNPTWSFYYRNLIKEFSRDHRVIAPDHIGCGLSSKPQNYDYKLESHIQNIENLIEALNVKSLTLVVHDWGGAIGFGFATRYPEKIEKVIILNTAAYTSNYIPWQINLCKTPFFGEQIIRRFNAFAYPATFMAVKKKLSRSIKRGYLYPYNNFENRIATSRFVQDIPMKENHPSFKTLKEIEEKLHLVKAPKIIIWGGKDFCFNDYFYKRWEKIYPEAKKVYLKNAGHYVIEDAFDEVRDQMRAFI